MYCLSIIGLQIVNNTSVSRYIDVKILQFTYVPIIINLWCIYFRTLNCRLILYTVYFIDIVNTRGLNACCLDFMIFSALVYGIPCITILLITPLITILHYTTSRLHYSNHLILAAPPFVYYTPVCRPITPPHEATCDKEKCHTYRTCDNVEECCIVTINCIVYTVQSIMLIVIRGIFNRMSCNAL